MHIRSVEATGFDDKRQQYCRLFSGESPRCGTQMHHANAGMHEERGCFRLHLLCTPGGTCSSANILFSCLRWRGGLRLSGTALSWNAGSSLSCKGPGVSSMGSSTSHPDGAAASFCCPVPLSQACDVPTSCYAQHVLAGCRAGHAAHHVHREGHTYSMEPLWQQGWQGRRMSRSRAATPPVSQQTHAPQAEVEVYGSRAPRGSLADSAANIMPFQHDTSLTVLC